MADTHPAEAATPSPSVQSDATPAPFAGAVYAPGTRDSAELARFIEALKADGVKLGGLIQEEVLRPDGARDRIDTVDIATGRRIVINQQTEQNRANHNCSLDVSALTETTAAIRNAIADGAELVIIEKFGAQEKNGEGLADDIFHVIMEEVPLLVAVPEPSYEAWLERTGGLGERISYTEQAFRDWWAALRRA